MSDEITRLRAQLAAEKEKALKLEKALVKKNPNRASLFLDCNFGASSTDVEAPSESAVKDVLANLAALGQASGLITITTDETDVAEATAAIPEDSKLLGRTLGRSVRKGQLNAHRALAAARWVDKEIRKLISLITEHGSKADGKYTIPFGVLFEAAADVMEAVSGTLKTAKKHGVVAFDAEVLFQGMSDAVVISLLKEEISDSSVDTYTYRQVRACSIRTGDKKSKGFNQPSQQGANASCAMCSKTIYAMEYIGVSGKSLHKSCFRCSVCKNKLRQDNFATMGDIMYCKTHYEEAFKKAGGYNFTDDTAGNEAFTHLSDEASTDEPLSNIESLLVKVAVDEAEAEANGGDESVIEEEEEDVDSDLDIDASDDDDEPVVTHLPPLIAAAVAPEQPEAEAAKDHSGSPTLSPPATTAAAAAVPAAASPTQPPQPVAAAAAPPPAAATPSTPPARVAIPPASSPLVRKQSRAVLSSRKLGASVRRGHVDKASALQAVEWVDCEVRRLVKALVDHGEKNDNGLWHMPFGKLSADFNDKFESLAGTLRTCKKQKIVQFGPRFLMKGAHDGESIVLLQESPPPSTLNTYSVRQIRQVSGRGFGAGAPTKPIRTTSQAPMLSPVSPRSPRTPVTPDTVEKTEKGKKTPKFKSMWTPWKKNRKSGIQIVSTEASSVMAGVTSSEMANASTSSETSSEATAALPGISVTDEASAIEDVMATLVVIASPDGDDDDSESAGEAGVGAASDASSSSTDALNPVKKAALSVGDDTKVLGRSLGASVRRGELRQERALAAARWVDKEIRKLIGLIVTKGSKADGKYTIPFGVLFEAAADVMEAVSGTLKTAKKHGVVAFDAEVLFQGMSDAVVISLLKEEISDSSVDTYTYRQVRACSIRAGDKKGKGFGQGTLQGSNTKCPICDKTVYAMEYIGISGSGLHKSCFKCTVCKSQLRQDNYATMDERYFCKTHYEEAFKKGGGSYDF